MMQYMILAKGDKIYQQKQGPLFLGSSNILLQHIIFHIKLITDHENVMCSMNYFILQEASVFKVTSPSNGPQVTTLVLSYQ